MRGLLKLFKSVNSPNSNKNRTRNTLCLRTNPLLPPLLERKHITEQGRLQTNLAKSSIATASHSSRVTARPELILGSVGEFETCPDWVPTMDHGSVIARIALRTMDVHGFDHRANWTAEVRNVSRLGSQPNLVGCHVFVVPTTPKS
jgi:hypothetical protein